MPFGPFETESNLSEDVGMFSAAAHARPLALETPNVERIILATDGSNQDPTARAFAAALGKTTGAHVQEHSGAQTAAEILRVCAGGKANLLVLPVPFGRDIGVLKDESLGSVADMVLLEACGPVFCVRDVMDEQAVADAMTDVLVPVTVHDDGAASAAGWAFRVLATGGRFELLAVADQDALEETRRLLEGAVDPSALREEALNRVLTESIGSLTAAVQKRGIESGQAVHVESRVGRFVPVVLEEANRRPRLTVVNAPKNHQSAAFHHAADIILGARGPVLVV